MLDVKNLTTKNYHPFRVQYYISSSGSNQVSGYNTALKVTNNGNIGVHTENPQYKFHLNGTGYTSGNFYINGNVGIGTTSPTEKLDVKGNLKIGKGNWTKLEFDATGNNDWRLNAHSDGESFHIRGKNSGTFDYHMTIKRTTGNVGIGNPNPNEKLDVNGGAIIHGLLKSDGLNLLSANNGYAYTLNVENNGNLVFDGSSLSSMNALIMDIDGNIGIGNNNPSKKLDVLGESLLNGKVQIGNKTITAGTHNTSNVKLTVDGHAIFRKVIVTQSNWADHVFDKEYELKSLTEVETYIGENKHLPEIPSEAEVLENGIELGEMNRLLLQKVEELTLYVIDLQSQINDLKNEE